MDIKRLGNPAGKSVMLLHGNLMCWRQFEAVIPLLEKRCHVAAVSTDGYDGTGETTFTTAEASAQKLEGYIQRELGGEIDLVFGESFGCATALMLFHRQKVRVRSMILSGAQYMNMGIWDKPFAAYVPRSQFKLLQRIQSADDEKLLHQFQYVPRNASLETLQNCTKEALALYKQVDTFKPRPDAKVAIWYGSREPNMKKAVQKIKRAFPNAEEHPFEGYGHGDIIGCPDVMAEQIERFMSQNVR